MAVESLPEAGALWFRNFLNSATIGAYSSQSSLYPAKNLLSPHRSLTWRSTSSTTDQYVVFDLGSAKQPECVALTDINFDTGTYIRFRGSSDSAQTTSVVYYDLPLYTQDSVSKVVRWYLGTPTSGTLAAKQYWGIRVLPATFGSYGVSASYFEIGSVWIGKYSAVTPDVGLSIKAKDHSDRVYTYGRTMWSDPVRAGHSISTTLSGLTFEEMYTLKTAIVDQGSSHALLDVHAYSSVAAVKAGGCFYGYFQDDPVSATLNSPTDCQLRIQFEEASG